MFAACQKDRLPFVNDWMFFMISFQHSSCFRFVWMNGTVYSMNQVLFACYSKCQGRLDWELPTVGALLHWHYPRYTQNVHDSSVWKLLTWPPEEPSPRCRYIQLNIYSIVFLWDISRVSEVAKWSMPFWPSQKRQLEDIYIYISSYLANGSTMEYSIFL